MEAEEEEAAAAAATANKLPSSVQRVDAEMFPITQTVRRRFGGTLTSL